jgi:penicillin-binding protein 1A
MSRPRFYFNVILVALLIVSGTYVLRRLLEGLPDMTTLENYQPSLSTHVFDENAKPLAELSIEKRALLTLNQIPVDLQNAVIAVEDDNFLNHWGISPKGIIRSALVDVLHGRVVQGASTITQQLAKQIFLSRRRTIIRKLREILLAIEIERNFSKSEILQLYLNQVYFGEGGYGVQAAAHNYFGKEVPQLTLADCALLAGLIRAPRANSPFAHPDNARRRRAVVLERMFEMKMITQLEKDAANQEPIPLTKPLEVGTQAPYFVEHVRHRMELKYGYNALWRGGLKIHTTLDLDMQKTAEEVMEKRLAEFDDKALKEWERKQKEALPTPEGVDVSTIPPSKIQGAFVLLDIKTGAVRVMIGGRDSIFNRAVQARRQPGSTFKAFVWAAALQSGMTAASLVDDTPLAYYYDGRDWRLLEGATDQYAISLATAPFAQSEDFKIWVPNNFDGKFLGTITLRKALAQSRNIASVRLIEKIGPPVVVDIAHRAGIQSGLDPVLSLGLGSSVVSPLEMASAFGTFANGGISVTPYTVESVEDASGKMLETHLPAEKEAMPPQLAYLVTNLLKGVVQNGTGSFARALNRPLAGKTGTTNDNRDLWFVGFTPDLVAAAWMGYDDFSSLGRKDWTGGSTVVPWWTEIMQTILKDYPKRDFPVPQGIVFSKIDSLSGALALPTCPKRSVILEAFQEGTEPKQFCTLDHSKPLDAQLAAEVPTGTPGTVSPVAPIGVEVSTAPLPLEGPPALPSDDELERNPNETPATPQKPEQPVIIE